jgi:6-methylsalicylate decarboxylase
MDGAVRMNPALSELLPNGVMPELRKLYFDTALTATAGALKTLLTVTDSSHLLFGSDFPFPPEPILPQSLRVLAATLEPADLSNVTAASAVRLMPGLAG